MNVAVLDDIVRMLQGAQQRRQVPAKDAATLRAEAMQRRIAGDDVSGQGSLSALFF